MGIKNVALIMHVPVLHLTVWALASTYLLNDRHCSAGQCWQALVSAERSTPIRKKNKSTSRFGLNFWFHLSISHNLSHHLNYYLLIVPSLSFDTKEVNWHDIFQWRTVRLMATHPLILTTTMLVPNPNTWNCTVISTRHEIMILVFISKKKL